MTPPTDNPIRWHAQKRKHWANPREIKPGYWMVEEGSGPRASVRRLAIVRYYSSGNWHYEGFAQPYGQSYAALELNLDTRHWKMGGPLEWIMPQLEALTLEYG